MSKLTLPIVVGKKYVRRDGKVITAQNASANYDPDTVFVGSPADRVRYATLAYKDSGRIEQGAHPKEMPCDLVADYIGPAKDYPNPDERCYGFKVGVRYVFTKPLVIPPGGLTAEQVDKAIANGFGYEATPDPHAESAAEYAKDMAVSSKAWEAWEYNFRDEGWLALSAHPSWDQNAQYRRRPL